MTPPLKRSLKQYFGFDQFKGQQDAIVQSVLNGHDTFVIMPTGGGKSLCYQLPALMSEGTAIVVSPLIALMKNQVDAIRGYNEEEGVAHVLNSSLKKREVTRVKKDIMNGVTKLLYVAPESLTKEENVDFLKQAKLSFYAIDEAHCISEWGHDFRPEYRNLRSTIARIERAPIIALTATATLKVQEDIQKNLGMEQAQVFKDSFNRPNLYYEIRPKVNVVKEIIRYVKTQPGKSGIVYCLLRRKVEELAETLQVNGIKALPYHAGLDTATRAKHQDAFLMEDVDVIVATIAFGMGIDKPDVRFVLHHDIPRSLESYYQETGRAGRDGGEGVCIAFYSYRDIEKLEKFMQGKPLSEQAVVQQLLEEVVAYAETSMSRRKFLLHYFGEEWDEKNGNGVGMDDNQRYPREHFEGKEYMHRALEVVREMKERFKIEDLSRYLSGMRNATIETYKLDSLDGFGSGKSKGIAFWRMVFRQAIVHGFLHKEIETYGILKITPRGEAYLKAPTSFMLAEDHYYDIAAEDEKAPNASIGNTSGADQQLVKILRKLRKEVAGQKNLPPYAIFQEASLEDMAIQYPITLDEMKNIFGVGEGKARKFGMPFLKLIERYVDENDIERPNDLVVKTVINKSSLKVYIIRSMDRKLPLEDIAAAKNLQMDDLLTEIERIVYSGTKVNIDYCINEILDEEQQKEIFNYFMKEAETDSIKQAMGEFNEEYSDEELRLMRIKFLSDVAN